AVLSIIGFVLIVWGFSLARQQPVQLWMPPRGMRHLASLLTLIAFVLLAATYVPRNAIKARLRHPMVLSVKVWALAHLLSNGNLSHVILFGTFLVWAVLSFRAARARDRAAGTVYAASTLGGTLATVVVGVAGWALFAFWAHGALIGIRPIG
ncbi:MAG: NnrU family protein, partial [Polaromonas sp.]|nr:NnrU family protein [Polaromonas sp.]